MRLKFLTSLSHAISRARAHIRLGAGDRQYLATRDAERGELTKHHGYDNMDCHE